jgi:hypothetical protein
VSGRGIPLNGSLAAFWELERQWEINCEAREDEDWEGDR